MSVGVSPRQWWLNRKSKLGLRPLAKKPPHLPGEEWWTDPPTTIPQPEHIEYVVEFQMTIHNMKGGKHKTNLQARVGAWLKAARRLLHEEMIHPDRADLHTTDGILIAAENALREALLFTHGLGYQLPGDCKIVLDVLQRRNDKTRNARAIDSAKHVSIPYWDPSKPNAVHVRRRKTEP